MMTCGVNGREERAGWRVEGFEDLEASDQSVEGRRWEGVLGRQPVPHAEAMA